MLKQLDIFYHITTNISNSEIEKQSKKAESLENRVLEFFKSNPNKQMIWSDVAQLMGLEVGQYGSCKRCITHLVNKGEIEKLKEMKKSIFGGESHKHVYKG